MRVRAPTDRWTIKPIDNYFPTTLESAKNVYGNIKTFMDSVLFKAY